MRRILSVFLVLIFVLTFVACGDEKNANSTKASKSDAEKDIIGNWYDSEGNYMEILSDNTYVLYFANSDNEKTKEFGEWKYLEEGFYKFYLSDEKENFQKIEIKKDEFGRYIYKGREYYKNKYPAELETKIENNLVACPDFIGMQYKDIVENDVYTDNFEIELKWNSSMGYDYGEIYEQSAEPDEMLEVGTKITLYVSKGPTVLKVPDVYGMTSLEAKSQLELSGFKVVLREIADDEITEGLVIKTEPQRTTVVEYGTEITVFISK